jgi:DUF1680 family protein
MKRTTRRRVAVETVWPVHRTCTLRVLCTSPKTLSSGRASTKVEQLSVIRYKTDMCAKREIANLKSPFTLSIMLRPLLLLLFIPSLSLAAPDKSPPALNPAPNLSLDLRGQIRSYTTAVTDNWLLRAPLDNPAMLDIFRDRDKQPYRNLLPWSGEFAGKYLTAGTQVLQLNNDPRLRAHLEKFVKDLIALQADDGYLGPFPKDFRLTGKAPNCPATWDAWGHYHIMLGLLLWHDLTFDEKALTAASRIGDLLCNKFLDPQKHMLDMGSSEMNHAPIHSLALLYRKTGQKRYLDLATKIVDEFALPGGGDYFRVGLSGKAFYQSPKPRWESLHPIMGLAELHRITGNNDYRKSFEQLWWTIAQYDRHNNGGFSSGEQAQGNPYHGGAIETCCTIAWMALSVEMLRTSGNSLVADELELSTLNQVLALHSPDGKWCTYNTPMDGARIPSTIDIAFQKRPGSEQLNCCSVNAARGFGLISQWALMQEKDDTLVLNWYGPSTMTTTIAGTPITIEQETHYPREEWTIIKVNPKQPTKFQLKLRIPQWSTDNSIYINGHRQPEKITPGAYFSITREWKSGDQITLDLDFTPHIWAGEKECAGKVSLYRGPILLAVNLPDKTPLPTLNANSLNTLNLIDYASAGANGVRYATWLPMKDAPRTMFSKSRPLPTARVEAPR